MATILTVTNLSKSFVVTQIFEKVNFQVSEGERIALVGVNGAGKSTLLKIIAGDDEADGGTIIKARGLRVTYLPQEVTYVGDSQHTILEEIRAAFADVEEMRAKMQQLEAAMAGDGAGGAIFDALMEEYGELSQQFEQQGGYDYETRIDQVLLGLGFSHNQLGQQLGRLSGGQKTRVALAKALLTDPDLLLLDEPTNHLDLAALEWLEDFLGKWQGTVILISHDRYFLDKATNRTLEMTFGTMEDYAGGYSRFLDLKAERMEQRMSEYTAQQDYIARTEDFIRRYKNSQKYRQARGRQKQLDRMERKQAPKEAAQLKLKFTTDLRSGQAVMTTDGLAVGYRTRKDGEAQERVLFTVKDTEVRRQDRIALVGPNGSGKSTLLKTIVGELLPVRGNLELGSNVVVAYYAQAHEGLNHAASIIDEIRSVQPMTEEAARTFLGRFMFSGDDVYRPVGNLSGGERSRVALAKLMLLRANFLILDEPTNHLDINAREALEEMLNDYQGTVLFVSHDRFFIDAIATVTWAVRHHRVESFVGNYSDYHAEIARREREGIGNAQRLGKAVATPAPTSGTAASNGSPPAANGNGKRNPGSPAPTPSSGKTNGKRDGGGRNGHLGGLVVVSQKVSSREVEAMERQIAQLEDRLRSLTDELGAATEQRDVTIISRLGSDYETAEQELERKYKEWERLAAQV